MKRILDGMQKTMMAVKPPRYTALEGLQKADTANPIKILIGTVLSARTKDENTTKAVMGSSRCITHHRNYLKPR